MRLRVAEIDEHAVSHVFGDIAAEAGDGVGDGAMISADDLAQILGIEPRRERGRADQVAEHHRELTPLRSLDARWWRWGYQRGSGGLPNRLATTTAEFGSGLVLEAAGRAGRRKWRPAIGTEAPCRHVFGHTAWAAHLVPPLARANRSARR
jgi:hypothetical protein